jgi:hypothetical protein
MWSVVASGLKYTAVATTVVCVGKVVHSYFRLKSFMRDSALTTIVPSLATLEVDGRKGEWYLRHILISEVKKQLQLHQSNNDMGPVSYMATTDFIKLLTRTYYVTVPQQVLSPADVDGRREQLQTECHARTDVILDTMEIFTYIYPAVKIDLAVHGDTTLSVSFLTEDDAREVIDSLESYALDDATRV